MKISFLIFLIVICFTLITTNSCNKGDKPTPEKIDSIKSVLPTQIIWTTFVDTIKGPETYTFNINYDTLNRQITMDVFDTIGQQNNGKIEFNYNYNNEGYLIKTEIISDSFMNNNIITITRGADNKILYMINDYPASNEKDTTFFTYSIQGGNTTISTKINQTTSGSNANIYKFNSENRILYEENGITEQSRVFDYNLNNSINKITTTDYLDNSFSNIAAYTYTSGIPDGKYDVLRRLLLGKDYFIPDIGNFYIFTFQDYVSPFTLSATDPYHVSSIEYPISRFGQISDKWTYELNNNQLVSKIIFNVNNKISDVVIFKY